MILRTQAFSLFIQIQFESKVESGSTWPQPRPAGTITLNSFVQRTFPGMSSADLPWQNL